MRWRFPDPSEEQTRESILTKMDEFWASFREKQTSLQSSLGEDPPQEISATVASLDAFLKTLHPKLSMEVSSSAEGRTQLALTIEGRQQFIPFLRAFLARAPHDLPWEILDSKPPKDLAATSKILGSSLSDWRCRVQAAPHQQIAVHLGIPGCTGPWDRKAHQAALTVAQTLLGETLFQRWIGSVHSVPLEEFKGDGRLQGLLSEVEAVKKSLLERLPSKPLYTSIEGASWTLYRFNPHRRGDYPFRMDLVTGKSTFPELWKCIHSGIAFYSERFSRSGETFCYLKIDSEEGFGEGGFESKIEAEDLLEEALQGARLGCVIGGGSGLRYQYIDLALVDVEAAVGIIARVLQEGKVPRRTWLLFFDDSLLGEWIPFHPKAPPPPKKQTKI